MSECKNIVEIAKSKLSEITGKVLVDFLVDVVEPEFNVAYLIFEDSVYSVNGAIGSEIITINKTDYNHLNIENRDLRIFKPYLVFHNKKIIQARNIGAEWNGHGFEISFEGIYDKSMIIQSIYAGDKPKGFEDCIRLGIGQYFYSSDSL